MAGGRRVSTYISIVILLAVALLTVGGLYLVARYTAVAADPLERMPFLSGWAPEEHALSRYHARWYPLTLLFLAFDVEMLFMYPWALVVAKAGISAVIEMFVFLGVLMVGVVWAWREGALRWV
ncbi:MAG: NADH-quinone oxidoreductase subunit A [Kineosporiaceae bacterium]|nr:NADH-quinone oxidoreductase subunit A [Aeromicrobium sp.]